MKDINVVIVNYKMKDDIDKCLTSLYSDVKDSGLDVIVTIVDNASYDGIAELLKEKYPQAKFIQMPGNEGFGHAQNAGMKACEAKYYFVLNPDTEFLPDSSSMKKMFDFMEKHDKIGMIGPKIVYPDGSLQYSCWRFPSFWQPIFSRTKYGQKGTGKIIADHYLMKDFDHNQTMPVECIMGSAMFVRKSALDEVGGFDDHFWMYFEDIDWCRRMWEKHWPVYYVHSIVIKHAHGRGSAKVPGIFRALIKNKLARIHLISWLKYFWKWRGDRSFR